jgi:8-oxo-dGTP diphosphatase
MMDAQSDVLLRCSALVLRNGSVLLVHRTNASTDDWVLPGGNPRRGESLAECVRREVQEETGLRIDAWRVAFVLEATEPVTLQTTVDVVFAATEPFLNGRPSAPESGLNPQFVPLDRLPGYRLRPSIAEEIHHFSATGQTNAGAYLGNLWRSGEPTRTTHPSEHSHD